MLHLLPLIIYWCWLFFMCKMFLLLLTDVYVIFCVLKHINKVGMHFIFICYLHDFLCGKYVCNFNTAFDILMMLTIFHVQNVLIIVDWCLCDFPVLKHIDEVDALHLHLSLTYFWCVENMSTISIPLLIIYWCWLFFMCKMFLSFSTDVYVIFFLLKHIDEVHALHFHLSLTYFLCGKYSTISILPLIIYWCWLLFMCKMLLLSLTDVYVIFSVLKHIDEVDALNFHLSLTYLLMWKLCLQFQYYFW